MTSKARILLVDDDDSVRSVLCAVLTGSGYSIVEAVDGEDAVRKCMEASFDLLLIDHNMPKKTGWDACGEIRRQKPGMKVVMLSGAVHDLQPPDPHVKFLPKPFHNRELISLVGEMVGG